MDHGDSQAAGSRPLDLRRRMHDVQTCCSRFGRRAYDNSKLLASNLAVRSVQKSYSFKFLTKDSVYELLFERRLKCHIDEVW